jgi:hypothetical protein
MPSRPPDSDIDVILHDGDIVVNRCDVDIDVTKVWYGTGAGPGRAVMTGWKNPGKPRSPARSASAAREAGASNGSAKYWVSRVTRSPANSMTLTE